VYFSAQYTTKYITVSSGKSFGVLAPGRAHGGYGNA